MTRGRTLARTTATATAAGFLLLSAGPAMAADTTAQAEGEAVTLSIGGMSVSDQVGGPYRVVRTGDREEATGTNRPRAELLTGQTAAAIGTLAQDATTALENGRGSSAACAGIAGDGASVASVGDAGEFCLTEGDSISLTAGQLDLSNLTDTSLVEGTPSLNDLLGDLLGDDSLPIPLPLPELNDTLDQLNDAVGEALDPLGEAGLVLNIGAIQSQCTAGPGPVAEGSARLADVNAVLQFPDGAPVEEIPLLSFEPDPAPNTNVATDLDDVVDLIVGEVANSLRASDLPPELTDALGEVQQQIRENLTSQIADQLGPLDENLISGTLNKQETGPGEIEVTALDLQVLPVLQDQAGFSAIDAQLGRSQCGPSGTVAPEPGPSPDPTPVNPPVGSNDPNPEVPRSVPAGLADQPSDLPPMLALGALVTLATATGIAVHRRASRV